MAKDAIKEAYLQGLTEAASAKSHVIEVYSGKYLRTGSSKCVVDLDKATLFGSQEQAETAAKSLKPTFGTATGGGEWTLFGGSLGI